MMRLPMGVALAYFLDAHRMAVHVKHIISKLLHLFIDFFSFKILIYIVRRIAAVLFRSGILPICLLFFPLEHSYKLTILCSHCSSSTISSIGCATGSTLTFSITICKLTIVTSSVSEFIGRRHIIKDLSKIYFIIWCLTVLHYLLIILITASFTILVLIINFFELTFLMGLLLKVGRVYLLVYWESLTLEQIYERFRLILKTDHILGALPEGLVHWVVIVYRANELGLELHVGSLHRVLWSLKLCCLLIYILL